MNNLGSGCWPPTEAERWAFPVAGVITAPPVVNGMVYLTGDGFLHAIGQMEWCAAELVNVGESSGLHLISGRIIADSSTASR